MGRQHIFSSNLRHRDIHSNFRTLCFYEENSPKLALLASGWARCRRRRRRRGSCRRSCSCSCSRRRRSCRWRRGWRRLLAAVSVVGPTPVVSTLRGLTYIGTVGDAAALFIAPRPFRPGALLPDRWLRRRGWSTGGKTALLLSEPVLAQRSVTCHQHRNK